MSGKSATKRTPARSSETSFVSGSLVKEMLRFAGPYMLGVLVQNLYGAVDLLVVGHYATTADVSAVTIGSQLMNIVTQLIIGFATGITVLVGQSFGAGNKKRLSTIVGTSAVLFGGAAAVLTIGYLACNNLFITMMQTPAEAQGAAREYLFACSIGILFITGYNIVNSILTGLGDSRTPFVFILVACAINVVLDIVLVRYFHMGALGAAIATTVAQAGSFFFALAFLRVKGLGFALGKGDLRPERTESKNVITIGAPVAVQNVLVGISFLFIVAIINQMGLAASAAVGVVEKLIAFLFVPAIGMSTAVATAASQNLGAGQPERARKSMWYGVAMALVPSVLICVFCQFSGETLTALFGNDPEVIALAANYLRSYIVDVVMVAFVFSMNGYFNSCNKSWFSLVHSLITTFALRVPLAWLFSRVENTSLYLIGWAAPLSTLASLVLCLLFLVHLDRQEKRLAGRAG
ncbi:MATE family efflux transporter [Ruminococcaceae bacterium OttesenSCG-928-A11]|nr:MATE family efflux transporter [Ruminococcaceae bacterium OttesenSCG-928-A11]